MIEKLLTEDLVDIKLEVKNWEEAVIKAGELLLNAEKIEEKYIQSMVETVKEIGAYIVMAPGIAMPHARPEAGVKEVGISVISLKNDISFGNEEFDPVKLVFAICAKESKGHIELLKDLSCILDSEELLEKLEECNTKKDLLDLILNIYNRNK